MRNIKSLNLQFRHEKLSDVSVELEFAIIILEHSMLSNSLFEFYFSHSFIYSHIFKCYAKCLFAIKKSHTKIRFFFSSKNFVSNKFDCDNDNCLKIVQEL